MGPSGAGKSSLMNILAGRMTSSSGNEVSGKLVFDGKAIDPLEFSSRVAYVMQDDALQATATPREALAFSAALRLAGLSNEVLLFTCTTALLVMALAKV